MLRINKKSKHLKKEKQNIEDVLNQITKSRKVHPTILELIGETETILSDNDLRKLILELIRSHL